MGEIRELPGQLQNLEEARANLDSLSTTQADEAHRRRVTDIYQAKIFDTGIHERPEHAI